MQTPVAAASRLSGPVAAPAAVAAAAAAVAAAAAWCRAKRVVFLVWV